MSDTLHIKVIAGSTREGRFSDKAAAWIAGALQKQDGVTVEVLDLRDYALPFFDQAETPSSKQVPYAHPEVVRWTAKIAEADAYVMVTPEYNHSTSGVLKNALDWVYPEWNNKAVGFVSYGSVGGARAVEQLRLIAIELQMAPIRSAIHIAGADYFPAKDDPAAVAALFAGLQKPADGMITQLLWWTKAIKVARG